MDFIVAYEEADSQLARTPDFAAHTIVISMDMDMFALGVRKLVYVHNWNNLECCYIDLDSLVAEHEIHRVDLVSVLLKHHDQQVLVFQVLAAAVGCDYSSDSNGLDNIGSIKAIKIMSEIEERMLTVESFAQGVGRSNTDAVVRR